ncbi:Glycosyl transferase family 2 [Treponema bryantii]|uniref:Glycosyl transferase family 2 n=1 Tax=Treponema bryantii TaxID=163 RepID=A0A1H9G871_9SPIR|nr:glycosyltransferase [Treponema bryantii]SEQ46335.1 Glycosyl transferase family 2 [Treponema bryantii]
MKRIIRNIILRFPITRELFFIICKRKVSLNKINKLINKLPKIDPIFSSENENIIVSLTSYGERINELKYVLYSLINQTIKPKKIIVNIAFDDEKFITDELKFFEKYNVEFFLCEDLKSFKKLIPTLERYPNNVIITCDDDMFYEKDWLEQLWKKHLEKKEDIIAHNIYGISYENNQIIPYDLWPHSIINKKSSFKNFLVGCGGVLYPPGCFYKDILNKKLFLSLTPYADDIWFYFMAILNGRKISQPDKPHISFHYVNPYREYGLTEGNTLTKINVGQSKNDYQFLEVMKYYFQNTEKFLYYIED